MDDSQHRGGRQQSEHKQADSANGPADPPAILFALTPTLQPDGKQVAADCDCGEKHYGQYHITPDRADLSRSIPRKQNPPGENSKRDLEEKLKADRRKEENSRKELQPLASARLSRSLSLLTRSVSCVLYHSSG